MPMKKGQPRAPQIPSTVPLEEAKRLVLLKVLPKITVSEGGCWVWQGWCNPQWEYGHTYWRGKNWAVHRLIWTVMRGEIPAENILCHRCDNPPCCNPEHLWLGTDHENHIDKTRKGRHHYDKATKTHCKWGHEFTPENTLMTKVEGRPGLFRRACRACNRDRLKRDWQNGKAKERQRRWRAKKRAERQESFQA